MSIKGGVGVKPAFADLEVKVDNVDMTFAQPYLRRQIRADLTSGNLSIDGNLLVGRRPTAEGIGLSYLGEFALKDVSAASEGRQILKWKKLEVAGIDYGNGPLHLSVQDVSLNDYYAVNVQGGNASQLR